MHLQAWIQGRWNGWIFTPFFLSPLLFFFLSLKYWNNILFLWFLWLRSENVHKRWPVLPINLFILSPQTPHLGFGSITLLQKFTPHFKILDPRLTCLAIINRQPITKQNNYSIKKAKKIATWVKALAYILFRIVDVLNLSKVTCHTDKIR